MVDNWLTDEITNKIKHEIDNWDDYKKEAYNEMFVSTHSKKLTIEKYTIEQIVDAIVESNNILINAIEYCDREMLKNILMEYLN